MKELARFCKKPGKNAPPHTLHSVAYHADRLWASNGHVMVSRKATAKDQPRHHVNDWPHAVTAAWLSGRYPVSFTLDTIDIECLVAHTKEAVGAYKGHTPLCHVTLAEGRATWAVLLQTSLIEYDRKTTNRPEATYSSPVCSDDKTSFAVNAEYLYDVMRYLRKASGARVRCDNNKMLLIETDDRIAAIALCVEEAE